MKFISVYKFVIASLLIFALSKAYSQNIAIKTKNSDKSFMELVSVDRLLNQKQKTLLLKQASKAHICKSSASKYQQSGNGPAIVGEYIESSFSSPFPYIGTTKPEGEITWKVNIHYPGASYIAPYFKSLDLSKGDTLTIRSPDNSRSWTYTNSGPRELGKLGGFWGIHIHGDTAIIELKSSSVDGGKGVFISRFARGFALSEMTEGTESLCTADDSKEAKCYQDSQPEMYDNARAVARLVKNGNAHCTGWLVGSSGHLLTNEHCITDQAEANQITIEFMAEGASCDTNCASALGCPGTIEATAPTFIKDSAPLDYALILPETPVNNLPDTYGFMQLRESGAVLDEQLYIPQHPAGWGKRIAFESTYPADTTGFGVVASLNEAPCSGGPGDIGYWLDTQGGSSGSPVLALDDHKVVALHHCRSSPGCAAGAAGELPNRGVPIQAVIADLGADLPNGATCNTPDSPSNISSNVTTDNQISINWTEPLGGTFTYNIYRSLGDCSNTTYELIASNITGGSYTDTSVSGGSTYAYKIKTFDTIEACNSSFSLCTSSVATGLCTLAPTFAGISSANNLNQNDCAIQLDWQAGVNNCGTEVLFNIYRSPITNFIPSASNLISSCETTNTYIDQDISGGVEYNYIVRAEDNSVNGVGQCSAGNEDLNTLIQSTIATGVNSTIITDDLELGVVGLPLSGWVTTSGEIPNSSDPWEITDIDSNSTSKAFFVSDEPQLKDQVLILDTVITPQTDSILEFWHRYNTESNWDGGALEYTTDGGATWIDILDGNGSTIVANPSRFLNNGYDSVLNISTSGAPLNGRPAWNGNSLIWKKVQVDLNDFSGVTIELRWRMSCDASVSGEGWFIDDITILTPNVCQSFNLDRIFINGFEN